MGWDAAATHISEQARRAFEETAQKVENMGFGPDFQLERGGLDKRLCGYYLQQATGEGVYDDFGWSPERVQSLAGDVEWPPLEEMNEKEQSAVVNARAFFEVCVAFRCGVSFSW